MRYCFKHEGLEKWRRRRVPAETSSVPRELLKALRSIFPQALALNTASSHKAQKKPHLPVVRHRFTPTDVRMALLAYIEPRLCVDRELGDGEGKHFAL